MLLYRTLMPPKGKQVFFFMSVSFSIIGGLFFHLSLAEEDVTRVAATKHV